MENVHFYFPLFDHSCIDIYIEAENEKEISNSYKAFYDQLSADFQRDQNLFWEKYIDIVKYDRAYIEAYCYFLLFENKNISLPYEDICNNNCRQNKVKIQITFFSEDDCGEIFFDNDKYSIPETVTKEIIKKHMPENELKAVQERRRQIKLSRYEEKAIHVDRNTTYNYGETKCLYCKAPITVGYICPRCNELYRKKRRRR